MKMYRDYLMERLGDEMVERPEGFATYRFIDDFGIPAVYIVDLYVRPDFRKTKIASEMADEIVKKAKAEGYHRLIGSVDSSAKNATDSIKVLLAYGMSLHRSSQQGLIFKKEI